MSHAEWAARGFRTVPIIPPLAGLTNPFNKALAAERGKAVGCMRDDGKWYGWKEWRTAPQIDPAVMDRWGAGVGLPCQDQCRALDIDCLAAVVAEALAAEAERLAGGTARRWGNRPKVLLLYRAVDPMDKMVLAFTLPGDPVKHKVELLADGQQFVAAGTHKSTGRPYEWDRLPVRADLPPLSRDAAEGLLVALGAMLRERFGAVTSVSGGGTGGSAAAAPPEALAAPSEAMLAEALAWIKLDASDRDLWIDCGMAIKGAGGTWEQWLEVSNRAMEEDPGEVERRWAGLNPRKLGWWWIEDRARGAGWTGSARMDFAGVDAPVLAGRAPAGAGGGTPGEAVLTDQEQVFRDWRWIEAVKRFGCLVDGAVLDALQFSARYPLEGNPMSGTKSAAAKFLSDERRKAVLGLTYKPGAPREVDEPGLGLCFNRWRPSDLTPARGAGEADVKPWLDHMAWLVPDERQRRLLVLWMAYVLQHQAEKPNWAPVLGGLPGIGKDLALSPLVKALGAANVAIIGMGDLEAAQNDWCAAARLVVVNEAHSLSRKRTAEMLKPHISAPPWFIRINTKNVAQYQTPNRHAMLFFTNRRDAVAIERGDRRYFVVWSEAEPREEAYYRGLWAWLSTGGWEAVAGWLLGVSLKGFNAQGDAPWTEAKAEMARDTMGEIEAMVHDALESDDWPDLVNPGDLADRLNHAAGTRGRGVSARALGPVLKQWGAKVLNDGAMVRLGEPCRTGADRVRLLSIRNHATYIHEKPAVLARLFTKMWAEKDGKEFKDVIPPFSVTG